MVVYKTDGKKVYYPGMFGRQTFRQTIEILFTWLNLKWYALRR